MANSVPLAVAAPAASSRRFRTPSALRRLYEAMIASRHRQADREIARFIEASGGFTDAVEREIERRFFFHRSTAGF